MFLIKFKVTKWILFLQMPRCLSAAPFTDALLPPWWLLLCYLAFATF